MWEITHIFGKWLKCLRNDQNMWEMTLSVENGSNMWGNDLIV